MTAGPAPDLTEHKTSREEKGGAAFVSHLKKKEKKKTLGVMFHMKQIQRLSHVACASKHLCFSRNVVRKVGAISVAFYTQNR